MTVTFRILILEDSPVDAKLVQYELKEAGFAFTSKVVMTEKDFVHELQEFCPDLILSDYDLPKYNGALALAETRRRCPEIPFILVTGAVGEDRAIEILTQGAKDYILKSRLQRLAPAVQRALAEAEEHRARKAAEKELLESHRILESVVEERSAALRESVDRYRSLFENMLNGFAFCRMLFDQERPQDFIYLDVNSAFESLTGLKNVVGKKVSEVIPGIRESDPELFEIYGRVALTGKPEKFEKYVAALNMWFSISVFSPEKEHFVAVFDDTTKRKQAEHRQLLWAELMSSINESHSLVNTINSILTSIKREMGFEAVGIRLRSGNDFPYFVQNGFSPDFLLTENTLTVRSQDGGVCRDKNGNISLECTCGLVISGLADPTSPLFTPGGSFWTNDSLPLLDLLPDQDPRLHPRNRCIHEGFHSVALIPIRANQEIVGLLQLNDRKKGCFTLDMITFFEGLGLSIGVALTRQRAEEAIKERTSQLESVNKELESFSYSISHDLRAPLRAINGFSRMLARDLKDKLDEESMHRLDTIRENGIKMNQLIDDVLTFSRLGNESLAMTVIDMADLATDVWNELQENNPQRNISINVAHPMACYGDQKMMRRVLTNLLSNAAKFTTERQTATIKVGSYENEDEYVYYVKDNGSGFDMQYSDKLFRLFQRLHSDADYEGTGAGLSIVKRIVERHGGRVWAEGKVNEGATFYFSLPK